MSRERILLTVPVLMAAGLLVSTSAPAGTDSKAVLNAPAANPPPSQSQFAVPSAPSEGRDPFFPNSTRLRIQVPTKTNAGPVSLTLKAISGTPQQPLAIINDRTFAVGETADVRTPQGRIKVKCLSIDGLKVRVEVQSETRELFMHGGQ